MKQNLFTYFCLLFVLKFLFACAANLRLYCGDVNNYTSAELNNSLTLMNNTCFDETLRSIFYAFGFTAGPNSNITLAILKSYLEIENYNVFLLDWEKEAASYPSYLPDAVTYATYAVPNAKKIGKLFGQAVKTMIDNKLNETTIHIMGHSLGAHTMGYGCQELKKNNISIPRFTGLDPAGPLYDFNLVPTTISPAIANFVVVTHTNPGVEGTARNLGTVDIWYNCDKSVQPQCVNETTTAKKQSCSHLAACYFYAEAVRNATAYAAERSGSCIQWQRLDSTPEISNIIYVGETTDTEARGSYYLRTRDQSPYGIGVEGIRAT